MIKPAQSVLSEKFNKGRCKVETLEIMEKIESIVERWQDGDIDSEEALEQITTLTDKEL